MSTLREAAQQALEALETLSDCYDGDDDYDGECASCHTRSYLPHDADCKRNNAITALRAALKREEEAITLELIGRQRDDHDTPPNTEPLALRLSEGLGAWVPAHERVPAVGTECVVLVRYTLDRPPFCTVDKWDVQREDPTGMGGPTIETGEGWNDNFDCDVIAWIAIPPHPPAEWDQRLPA